MLKSFTTWGIALFGVMASFQLLKADMIIAVSDGNLGTFVPGSINQVDVSSGPGTVRLSVWAYDTAPAGRTFTGYNLAFDLSPIGGTPGFSSNFTLFSLSNSVITSVIDPTTGDEVNYDFKVSTTASSSVGLSGTPIKLFDLSFVALQSTPQGLYNFSFVPGALDSGLFGDVPANDVAGISEPLGSVGGQFNITAVPEPSTMVLVGLVAAGGGAVRFARRRRAVR